MDEFKRVTTRTDRKDRIKLSIPQVLILTIGDYVRTTGELMEDGSAPINISDYINMEVESRTCFHEPNVTSITSIDVRLSNLNDLDEFIKDEDNVNFNDNQVIAVIHYTISD